jgi:hypothetical protein
MWRIWWAPNNASRWQMGFNSAFKGLKLRSDCSRCQGLYTLHSWWGCFVDTLQFTFGLIGDISLTHKYWGTELSCFTTLSVSKALMLWWKKYECGEFAEWYWQGKDEVWKKPVMSFYFECLYPLCYLAKFVILQTQPKKYYFGFFDPWRQRHYVSPKSGDAIHLTTQYQTPDNLNPQQNRRQNLILSYF